MIGSWRALGCEFTVTVDDADIGARVTRILAALPSATAPTVEFVITRTPSRLNDGDPAAESGERFDLVLDGDVVELAEPRPVVVDRLVQWCNALAAQSPAWVSSHASGVARDGVGIVFPAHMESGKTTLAAGLVRAGFGYLSDEAIAFDWHTGVIEPYPKPLSLDRGSWPLFPELAPPEAATDGDALEIWQVAPDVIRPGAVAAPCRAALVVFPRYVEGADTAVVPMTRGEALVELARNTFHFSDLGRRALESLAGVVRGADCYRMTVGDLDAAIDCITGLSDG